MKQSTFLLLAVAVITSSIAFSANSLVVTSQPSSIIYVPLNENPAIKGGGLSVKMPQSVSEKQAQVLTLAYEIAKNDNHKYPQLLQGILLQETLAGGLKKYSVAGDEYGLDTNKRYYGLGQIKLSAAQDVLMTYPEMWTDFDFHTKTDEEVIAKLITDDRFNISVASKYLLILRSYGYTSPHELAKAYNMGPGGARKAGPTTAYSEGVMRHIASIKSIINKHG